jgi:hypothetical protein
MTRPIVRAALAIDELSHTLGNVCCDTHREVADLPDEEIVSEAAYVLSCFFEAGHINNEALVGEPDGGPCDRKWALSEIRKLRVLLKKYRKAPTPYEKHLSVRDRFVG